MNKVIKWIIIVVVFGCSVYVVYVGFWIFAFSSLLGAVDEFHSYQELVDNYKSKTQEIQELNTYIDHIVPPDKYVFIEFKDNTMLEIFHIKSTGEYRNNWDIEIKSNKADSLLTQLGWTTENLKILKQKLDNANCANCFEV